MAAPICRYATAAKVVFIANIVAHVCRISGRDVQFYIVFDAETPRVLPQLRSGDQFAGRVGFLQDFDHTAVVI